MQPRPGVLLTPLPCREPRPRRGRTEDGRSRCGPGLLEARAQGRRFRRGRAFRPRAIAGARAAASCLPEALRARLAGMPATLLEARGARVAAFRPWAIVRRKGEGLPSPGSASRKAGGHARNLPGSARREGVLPTRARLPAGNAAFLGPPPGWGSRGTGAENPPGRGMGLGGFGKREGDQWESLVETSGRCSRSSRSVRPRPGVSSRWMWPSRMPMSPSMISGKVR